MLKAEPSKHSPKEGSNLAIWYSTELHCTLMVEYIACSVQVFPDTVTVTSNNIICDTYIKGYFLLNIVYFRRSVHL